MITEFLLRVIIDLLMLILGIFPNIPNISIELYSKIIAFFDLIFTSSVNILGVFVNISTLKVLFPIFLVVINFDKLYKLLMWIIRKLPWSID